MAAFLRLLGQYLEKSMTKKRKLSASMTEAQFSHGYWYAAELKAFARRIGIPTAAKLRKDELEKLILHFLRTGETKKAARKNRSKSELRDFERGLRLSLPVVHYTSNKQTKDFIVSEARRRVPGLKQKSGARYWLNRWREEKLKKGSRITYEDLVKRFIRLNQTDGRLPQIPSARFNNFVTDFLAAERDSSKADALRAWEKLKKLDLPKNYKAWASRGRKR